MARIRTVCVGDITRVVVTGRLSARDMGRLEHACAPALLADPVPLEIDVRRVTDADDTASALLARMALRGARITGVVRNTRSPPRGR